ncbi:MAG TPA: hypothetical protein VNB29_09175 [Chthoniobacterales bacterium]|nr:hypothetical protein [Chthoniobacterales bacterium]
MKFASRHIWIGLGSLCIVLVLGSVAFILYAASVFLAPTNARDNADPGKRAEMTDISRRWGQLAAFPATAKDFSIHTEGNMFTRTFRGSFAAEPAVILQWLKDSRGVSQGQQEEQSDKSTKYILKTAEDASYGEVIVSPDRTHVSFRVSWS